MSQSRGFVPTLPGCNTIRARDKGGSEKEGRGEGPAVRPSVAPGGRDGARKVGKESVTQAGVRC